MTPHQVGDTITFTVIRPDGSTVQRVAHCIGGRHNPDKHRAMAQAVARFLSNQDHRGSAAVAAPSLPPLADRVGVTPHPASLAFELAPPSSLSCLPMDGRSSPVVTDAAPAPLLPSFCMAAGDREPPAAHGSEP